MNIITLYEILKMVFWKRTINYNQAKSLWTLHLLKFLKIMFETSTTYLFNNKHALFGFFFLLRQRKLEVTYKNGEKVRCKYHVNEYLSQTLSIGLLYVPVWPGWSYFEIPLPVSQLICISVLVKLEIPTPLPIVP